MPNRTNTRPLHAGTEEILSNYCRGQRFNTLVKCSYYSVRHAEIRTWDNEISVHLVNTQSSQPETKRRWACCFNRLAWAIVSHAAVFEPAVRGILKKTQSFDPGGLGKSLALSLSALKVITFPHTPYVCSSTKDMIDIRGRYSRSLVFMVELT